MRSMVMAGLAAGLLGPGLYAGCATPGPEQATEVLIAGDAGLPANNPAVIGPQLAGGALPATFSGVVPCADCPGILWTLNLYPDGVFRQRLEYLERSVDGQPARFGDAGRWALSADGRVLELRGNGGATDLFALRGDDTLRKLDADGHAIETTLNYDLKRARAFTPFEPDAKRPSR